jgi:hypothetical protein
MMGMGGDEQNNNNEAEETLMDHSGQQEQLRQHLEDGELLDPENGLNQQQQVF